MSCKTWSQMCGSWYFPKFLLSEGSFTQMYTASLMFLMTPWDFLSTMVKHSGLTGCPVEWLWWCIGDGALRCFLSLSLKVLPDSHMYSSGQFHVWAFESIYDSTLLKFAVPVLGAIRRFYSVDTPEMYLDSQVVACPLEPFPQSMDERYH